MTDVEVFEIEDDFDPLEDAEDEAAGEEDRDESDYQLPVIPDADKSVMPEPVHLTPAERIDALFKGLPGQEERLLFAIEAAAGERRSDELIEAIEQGHPARTSVYDAAQVVRLLERAGALELREEAVDAQSDADEAPCDADAAAQQPAGEAEGEYLTVAPVAVRFYRATDDGLAALEFRRSVEAVRPVIEEEPQYRPIYKTVLELLNVEGGTDMKSLDAAVNGDPLLEQPRRFCGYFLDRLERAGAARFDDAWRITPLGVNVLESDIFAE